MKRTILSIALLLGLTSFASAQLSVSKTPKMETISKVAPLGVLRMELKRGITDGDTTYMLIYPNNAFKQLSKRGEFHLKASTQDMLDLEKVMLEVLDNKESKEHVTVTLGEKEYYFSRTTMMGFPTLMIAQNPDYDYTYISEKEIKKIFSPFHGDEKKK